MPVATDPTAPSASRTPLMQRLPYLLLAQAQSVSLLLGAMRSCRALLNNLRFQAQRVQAVHRQLPGSVQVCVLGASSTACTR